MFEDFFGDRPFIFRINDNGSGPPLLAQVCLERGWKEFNASNGEQWNLWWKSSGFSVNYHRNMYPWQYINHIPKGSSICRKDNLVRYLRCMRKVYGSIYDFTPHGYNLPLEYTKLAAECSRSTNSRPLSRCKDHNNDGNYFKSRPIWICKPVAQSQGRGIYLFQKLSELSYDSSMIVQRYIEKPLLIGGYKFDLRLYVCVPSYHPVTIYLYREGLVRFGTDKFNLNDLRNPFRHLTNSSINKFGPGYGEMKDRIGSGCKWTLRQLRRYFQQAGISDWLLWQKISSLVILTVLSNHVSQIPPTANCFEFFGFDVLIDSSLRPWLLEVNLSPALSNDCDADTSVKKPMLHDMFDLLGLPLYNTGLAVFDNCFDQNNNSQREQRHNVIDENIVLKSSMSVLSAAEKWRKKQKKKLVDNCRLASANNNRLKEKRNSSEDLFPKSYINLPKLSPATTLYSLPPQVNQLGPDYGYCQNKNLNDAPKRSPSCSKKWGNAKDWSNAVSTEGGWVRICPVKIEPIVVNKRNTENINIKHMVADIIKFSKTAKDLAKQHPAASESQLNEFFQEQMGITSELWIPPI